MTRKVSVQYQRIWLHNWIKFQCPANSSHIRECEPKQVTLCYRPKVSCWMRQRTYPCNDSVGLKKRLKREAASLKFETCFLEYCYITCHSFLAISEIQETEKVSQTWRAERITDPRTEWRKCHSWRVYGEEWFTINIQKQRQQTVSATLCTLVRANEFRCWWAPHFTFFRTLASKSSWIICKYYLP